MNEYELVDAMASLQSNLIQGQAITITMLSAYMVVAYTVGKKLTTFQCTFVSIVFLIFGLLGVLGQVGNLNEMYFYGAQLGEVRSGPFSSIDADSMTEEAARWVFVGVRLLIFAGALYFMWSVRHPKTD